MQSWQLPWFEADENFPRGQAVYPVAAPPLYVLAGHSRHASVLPRLEQEAKQGSKNTRTHTPVRPSEQRLELTNL